MTHIELSPRTRARLINERLGSKGYVAKLIKTDKEYIVFANEKARRYANNGQINGTVDCQLQVCTFEGDDKLYVILNSKKMRDQVDQLERMLDPVEAMKIAKEYETTSQRLEMHEKSRWILERFAGLVSQIGYGSTGDSI